LSEATGPLESANYKLILMVEGSFLEAINAFLQHNSLMRCSMPALFQSGEVIARVRLGFGLDPVGSDESILRFHLSSDALFKSQT
jgi:hypothetical protein